MVVVAGGHGHHDVEGGAAGGMGCGAVCFEPDGIETQERWVYKGQGMGSYAQVGNMEMVGAGKGDFEKERVTVATGARLRTACLCMSCLAFLLTIAITLFWPFEWSDRGAADACDVGGDFAAIQLDPATKAECCARGLQQFCEVPPVQKPLDQIVVHDKYYTQVKNVHVPHMVPVPIPPPPRQVITHKVLVHTHPYNCDSSVGDYIHTWTRDKQRYCCYKRMIGCHTKVTYRPHYHTITHIKHVTVPVPEPIPAPPPRVINHVVNVPIHDPPRVIKVPVPGQPHVVPKYVHEKRYVPVPEPSPPTYHNVPVPVPVKEPGKVIKVPVPLPPATVVKNKVIYRTRHVKMLHVYDCDAGFSNWQSGWSSAKKSWCCSNKNKGCPGDHSGELTKTIVTHVTQHEGPSYYSHHHTYYDHDADHDHHYSTHYHYGDTTHHYGDAIHHYGTTDYDDADTHHYSSHDYDGAAHVVHVHHYHYGSHSNLSARRLGETDETVEGSEGSVESGEGTIDAGFEGGGGPMEGGEGTIDAGFEGGGGPIEGGEGTIDAGFEGGEGPIEGGEGTIDGGFEGGVGAIQNENGEIENGGVVGPDWGSYSGYGGAEGNWNHGHYGYYNHAGTWVDQKFPYDAWHGHHYGHYDHSGSFISSSYPHDAWVHGHWGHYDHSGAWIEVHHPENMTTYHDAWRDGHYGHYDHHGVWIEVHHPAEGSSVYHDAWVHGHGFGHYDHGVWVSVHPGHAYHDAWVHGHYGHYDHHGVWVTVHPPHVLVHDQAHVIYGQPKHVVEKNYYSVKTKTHVIHDPVHVPGPTIHKTITQPAKPFYDCFNGFHSWKTLWTTDHKKYCCYKYTRACEAKTIQHVQYHTVVQNHNVQVPVPKPIPVHLPPPAPEVIKVPVKMPPPPRKVVKVPYQVQEEPPEPKVITKVIKYNKRVPHPVVVHKTEKIPVPVKQTKIIKVPVPVPSPPKIVYKTEKIVSHPYDCEEGAKNWQDMWSHSKRLYCCWKTKTGCPHAHTVYHTRTVYHTKEVPRKVEMPPEIIYKDVSQKVAIDCNSGYSNWYYGWSSYKKHYCCDKEKKGCPGSWKGFMHGHAELHVGHETGHIYDCKAGFSNWLHGWSDSKKTWCCEKEEKGCVKFHCDHHEVSAWSSEKKDWCCGNFQKGCAATTLSPKGCATDCVLHGESSTCQERIDWTSKHQFGAHQNACELAYSKIQVECDVCRSCSVQAAGCQVHAVAQDPYDCNAALNNFFRAWSPPKKQWCCNNRGKGCEGNNPPSVDPGAGMTWKHVQVNGFWTWVVAAAGGGAMPPSLPYACDVGVVNWKIGWSAGKKAWCCSNKKIGCPGQAGGDGVVTSHVTVTHGGGAGGAAGGAAGGGGASASWSSSWHSSGGGSFSHGVTTHEHHEFHVHHDHRRLSGFDCAAGRASRTSWPQEKKDYCCKQDSGLCDS